MKKSKFFNINSITKVALFTAIATILCMLEVPLWFAPDFYKFDLSSSVALLGSFYIGPLAGIIIAVLKTVLKALIMGTSTAFVGEYVDIIITILYAFPAAIIYRNSRTSRSAACGMSIGILSMTVIGCLMNYFLLIPLYAKLIGVPIETIIESVSVINRSATDLKTMIMFVTAPFNFLKGIICSTVAYLCLIPLNKITKNTR